MLVEWDANSRIATRHIICKDQVFFLRSFLDDTIADRSSSSSGAGNNQSDNNFMLLPCYEVCSVKFKRYCRDWKVLLKFDSPIIMLLLSYHTKKYCIALSIAFTRK